MARVHWLHNEKIQKRQRHQISLSAISKGWINHIPLQPDLLPEQALEILSTSKNAFQQRYSLLKCLPNMFSGNCIQLHLGTIVRGDNSLRRAMSGLRMVCSCNKYNKDSGILTWFALKVQMKGCLCTLYLV